MRLATQGGIERRLLAAVSSPGWSAVLLCIVFIFLAQSAVTKLGMSGLVLVLGGLLAMTILTAISLHDLTMALMIWMLSMSGFRYLGMVRMPVLPDFSIDRLMLVWIMLMFLLHSVVERRRLKGPFGADIVMLAGAILVLFQAQRGGFTHFHEWVLSTLSPLFAYFYGKNVINKEREIRNIMIFLSGLCLYYTIQAIAEHFMWRPLIWPKTIIDYTTGFVAPGRSRGPMLHPPLFGQLVGMVVMVQFLFLVKARTMPARLGMFVLLGAGLLALFFSYTRGPWLAAGVALVLLTVLRPGFRRVTMVLGVVLFIGALFGALQMANTEFFQDRMNSQNTVENRLGIFANTLRIIRDHPFLGIGYFEWQNVVGLYNQAVYVPLYGFVKKSLGAGMPIHDIYLGRLAEEGIFSSILQFTFYFMVLRAWLRKWRLDPRGDWFNRDTLAVMAATMVCYLVGGMVIDYRYFDLVNVIFYFFAGIICGYSPRIANNALAEGRAMTARS